MNNNTYNKTSAELSSKGARLVLWLLAMLCIVSALRYLALLKTSVCIVLCVAAFVFSLLGILSGVHSSRATLVVEEKSVCFTTLSGKVKYLPLDSITAVETSFMNSVCISSPSCKMRCVFVRNKAEITQAIRENIEKRA